MRFLIFLSFILLLNIQLIYAQSSPQAREVFSLINMAREKPKEFLNQYRVELNRLAPKFIKLLEQATPIQKVIWDTGLESMTKAAVEGNLDPTYPGSMNGFYLSSSGSGSNSAGLNSIDLICGFYSIVNDPASSHFAIYTTRNSYAFQWGHSRTINSKRSYVYNRSPDSSRVDFNMLHTARREIYMSEFDRLMIREINFARMYPSVYADIVGVYMANKSKEWNGLSRDEIIATEELIEELRKAQPAGLLQPKECLYRAVQKHGLDCKRRGFTDHTGSDGSSPFDRIATYCNGSKGNENIVGTVSGNIRQSVIALLVDDGISNRGHRYNMLNPEWKFVASFSYVDDKQKNPEYYILGSCIQNFSK